MRFPCTTSSFGLALLLLASAVACSDPPGNAGTSDAGVTPGDDEGNGDGGGTGADGGPSTTCTVLGTHVLADDAKELSNLSVAGSSLVFVSSDLTLATPSGIEKIQQDGSGRTALYTPTGDRRVHELVVRDDRIFFFEQDNAAPDPKDELWSLPLAGGTPTRLGTELFVDSRMIGTDAKYLYVARATNMPAGARFDRIELATGAAETVAVVTDRGLNGQMSISGNDIFYLAGGVGGNAALSEIHRFDKTAVGAAPVVLPGGTDALCDSRLGGIMATPTKLGCGFAGLKASARDGTGIGVLLAAPVLSKANVLVGTDAENFYVMDGMKAGTGAANLRKVASTGGTAQPVACDLNVVQNRLTNAVFPRQTEYEVTIGATDVFWIEKRGLGNATRWFVRRAAK